MALSVTPAIPASQIVNVLPSVLSAGGTALDLVGMILTENYRFPTGQVMSFADAEDVADYVGANDQLAALSTIYFNGPNNATVAPAKLLIGRYPLADTTAWLRSGAVSGLSLAQLQAINGPLSVTIDGVVKSATIDLSGVPSFSNAGIGIADELGIEGVAAASIVGSIGGTFTGSTSGTTLTVTAVLTGSLQDGDVVSGSVGGNALPGGTTIVNQLTGTLGGVGTYTLSAAGTPGNVGSTTITALSITLKVTAVNSGTLGVGDVIAGTGITAGTYIATQISGTTGGVGLYSLGAVPMRVGSETINAFTPAVQYDSTSGSFFIFSGTAGTGSTISFGSGAAAAALKLTSATGAVLSQGADATDPTTFMDAVIDLTQDWASFMTAFEPSDADKEAFATWTGGKRNRYIYEMWDTNPLDIQNGAGAPAVAFVNTGALSGISMWYEDPAVDTVGGELAAFGMGWTASLDFGRTQGRQTQAFRSQSGLAPQVFSGTAALHLIEKGMNFYGDYTTANEAFTFVYPGAISGPFAWKDSYANQVWLNNQLQLAIMVGMTSVGVIPYNFVGAALIEGFCMDPINAAVNFGAIVAGVELSAAQKVEVNTAAGTRIDNIITNRGWYLQVKPASAQVRAARTSPPVTLWYADGGSIQKIDLASIEIQ